MKKFPFVYLNDPVAIEIFGKIHEENIERMTSEVASEHFPLPRPYREEYHPALVHPTDEPIPEEFGAICLQSGEKRGGSYAKRGRCYRLCAPFMKNEQNRKLRRPCWLGHCSPC